MSSGFEFTHIKIFEQEKERWCPRHGWTNNYIIDSTSFSPETVYFCWIPFADEGLGVCMGSTYEKEIPEYGITKNSI